MPRTITRMLISQKMAKLSHGPAPMRPHPGRSTLMSAWIAWPPIQVWIPNQPQATSARSTAGTLAPRVPKDARASTGKGMP